MISGVSTIGSSRNKSQDRVFQMFGINRPQVTQDTGPILMNPSSHGGAVMSENLPQPIMGPTEPDPSGRTDGQYVIIGSTQSIPPHYIQGWVYPGDVMYQSGNTGKIKTPVQTYLDKIKSTPKPTPGPNPRPAPPTPKYPHPRPVPTPRPPKLPRHPIPPNPPRPPRPPLPPIPNPIPPHPTPIPSPMPCFRYPCPGMPQPKPHPAPTPIPTPPTGDVCMDYVGGRPGRCGPIPTGPTPGPKLPPSSPVSVGPITRPITSTDVGPTSSQVDLRSRAEGLLRQGVSPSNVAYMISNERSPLQSLPGFNTSNAIGTNYQTAYIVKDGINNPAANITFGRNK